MHKYQVVKFISIFFISLALGCTSVKKHSKDTNYSEILRNARNPEGNDKAHGVTVK